ncbi:helix-turn-helix transcriptional regulator [Tuberibacillus sp. Marseille-P3662]|uniref:helix-turn-helix transcriptional regulator n=1 Tax=Tuberibacillus sp. Marseille-P3662 TaxID=1965358 RepID=UPI003F93C96C
MNNKVKVARVAADLTQQQLAEKIGITRQTISLIEKGKYNPTLNLCLAICHAVGKTLDDLFWVDEEEHREKD